MFRFEVNGPWDDSVAEIMRAMLEDIRKQVASMECPHHGRAATVRLRTRSGDRVDVDLQACCEAFHSEVAATLR